MNKKINERDLKLEELAGKNDKLEEAKAKVKTAEKVQMIMQKAAKMSQDHLAKHLSKIVTPAVQAVTQKPYEFVCEFVERRGSTEADMYLVKDGNHYDILRSTGGGVADACSFALKVAYLMLSNNDNVLVIDEVCRHINSHEQRVRFAQVMEKLSKEFGIQLIINTTLPELLDVAENVITLDQVNGETIVK